MRFHPGTKESRLESGTVMWHLRLSLKNTKRAPESGTGIWISAMYPSCVVAAAAAEK